MSQIVPTETLLEQMSIDGKENRGLVDSVVLPAHLVSAFSMELGT